MILLKSSPLVSAAIEAEALDCRNTKHRWFLCRELRKAGSEVGGWLRHETQRVRDREMGKDGRER